MTVQAYPLQWPKDRKRNQNPIESNFKTDLSVAANGLINEISLLGGVLPVISSNMQLRADGIPYARQPNVEDTGVAVYFTLKGASACFACDKYIKLADNLQAIRKTIEALRGISRWGSSDMMDTAFSGFLQLPAPGQSVVRSWREVMGIGEGIDDLEYVRHQYKKLSGQRHPDKQGGSAGAMAELNAAMDQAEEALK
jgi:hypothetical protein